MTRITIPVDLPEVDLFGHIYTVKPLTRSVSEAFEKVTDLFEGVENHEQLALAYGRALDIRLVFKRSGKDALKVLRGEDPVKQPEAAEVVAQAWSDDLVSVMQLHEVVSQIGATDRPTVAQPTT